MSFLKMWKLKNNDEGFHKTCACVCVFGQKDLMTEILSEKFASSCLNLKFYYNFLIRQNYNHIAKKINLSKTFSFHFKNENIFNISNKSGLFIRKDSFFLSQKVKTHWT